MKRLQNEYGVKVISEAFGISRSGMYKARRKTLEPSSRSEANHLLLKEIRRIAVTHKGRYGSPRMTMELHRQGLRCGENRVARIMREHGIKGLSSPRKRPHSTDSKHGGLVAPNIVKGLEITHPNHVWVMDLTYLRVGGPSGPFVYLAAVLDLFTRQIVGWDISDYRPTDLAMNALRNAVARIPEASGVIIHSDRGSEYCSGDFLILAGALGFVRSMSAKGNCYDNATMESFFGVLKREELDLLDVADLQEARAVVFAYIEGYYNTQRLHTSIGMTPSEFAEFCSQGHVPSTAVSTKDSEVSKHESNPKSEKRPEGITPPATTHGRTPGYPSRGCSPAEPLSVSPSNFPNEPNSMDVE